MFESIKTKLVNAQRKLGFKEFGKDETGYVEVFKGLVVAVVAIVVISILVSALIPTAITSIVAVNTTTWGAGSISMWSALPIFIVLVVLMLFVAILLGML
jgi:Flp pilus assembly pilin Flp